MQNRSKVRIEMYVETQWIQQLRLLRDTYICACGVNKQSAKHSQIYFYHDITDRCPPKRENNNSKHTTGVLFSLLDT